VSWRSVAYLVREGLQTAGRNPALSVAALISTVASLLVLAIVLLITSNLERQAEAIESRRVLDVYLADQIAENDRLALELALRELSGVARVTYVSKAAALEAFSVDTGRYDLVEALGYNPLPASFRIELAPGMATGERMKAIAEEAVRHPGVEDVRYGGEWIERLDAALRSLRFADLVVAALVGLAVAFAVNSTIRLTVLARREMVEIMRDVGATDAAIATPFLAEGIAQSLVAALVTLGTLKLVTLILATRLGIAIHFLAPREVGAFIAFAVGIGFLGALWSVGSLLRRTA
jgi:cell division transport system permease protein